MALIRQAMLRAFWLGTWLVAGLCQSAAGPSEAPSAATSSFVRLAPEGMPPLTVNVEAIGRGPPILLLHGLGGSTHSWRLVAPRLATTHRVIAMDLRGFGRSDKPFDQAYGLADHASVVRAFIRQAGLARLTLVGHSYGGMVALRLAVDRRLEPHRIARLVIMASPAFPQPFSDGVRFLRKPILPYVALLVVPPQLVAALTLMTESAGFAQLTDRDISIYADPLSDPGGPHALIETAQQIVPPDLDRIIARYPAIAVPTLALWCRDDRAVPLAAGVRLARTIPDARLAVMEGCDHMPAEQAPQAVATEIRRFLGR